MISSVIFLTLIKLLVLQSAFGFVSRSSHDGRQRKSDADGLRKSEEIVAQFSARYFGELLQGVPKKSFVTSPLASLISLAPLLLFSEGSTQRELTKVLAMNTNTVLRVLPSIIKVLNKDQNGAILDISSAMFFNKNLKVTKSFNKTTKKVTGLRPRSLDFSDVEGCAAIINGWISNRTHHSIKYVMKPDMFSSRAAMMVVNTLYFKNAWNSPFSIREKTETFFSSHGEKNIQYMHEIGRFEYTKFHDIGCQVLIKRYANSKFASIFILPSPEINLMDVVKNMKQGQLLRDILHMKFILHPVEVIIPAMSIENSLDVIPITNEMGIKKVYTNSAELKHILKHAPKASKRSKSNTLKVSQIVQGIKFVMNENGTEEATSSKKPSELNGAEALLFKADHPFVFVVVREELVLYMGTFDP